MYRHIEGSLDFRNQNAIYSIGICKSSCGRMVKAIGLKLISLWERRFEPYQLRKFYFSPNVPTYRGKWLVSRNQITMYSLSICKSSCGRVVKAIGLKPISLWERRFKSYQLWKFYFSPNVPTYRGKWLDFRNQITMYSLSICKSSCGRVVKAIGLKPISLWERRFEPYQLRKFFQFMIFIEPK